MSDESIAGAPSDGAPQHEVLNLAAAGDDAVQAGLSGQTRAAFLKRAAALGVGTSVTASLLAACGGGGDSSVAAPSGPSGSETVKPNLAAKYKKKTIGFAELTEADENQLAIVKWAEQSAKDAGLEWSWKVVDTMGNTGTAQQTLDSFLTQGVDGIMFVGIGATTVEAQLNKAKAAGVPTIATYSFAPADSSLAQDYTLPPSVDASLLGSYLVKDQLNRHPSGTIQVGMLDFPADVIQERRYAMQAYFEQDPRFEVVAEDYSVSVTNTEQDATAKAKAMMQANPDLAAIWCNYPPIAVPAASAVEQVGKTEDVQVYGHIATSAGVEALRGGQGALVATSWVDWPYVGYTLVDQMLFGFSGEQPDRQLSVLKPDPSIVFDASNVETEVPKGTKAADWMFAGGTYRTQFLSEWNERYGA